MGHEDGVVPCCVYILGIYLFIHHLATPRYSPTASQIGLDRLRTERIPYGTTAPFTPPLISGQTEWPGP